MEQNDFYIGWQAEAPSSYAYKTRQFVIVVVCLCVIVAGLLVTHQEGFYASTFEFGQTTVLEGTFIKQPFPFLKIFRGNDVQGNPVFQYMLLVAPGKHGLKDMISETEARLAHSLQGKSVRLEGSLIYHDGKTLMEVNTINEKPGGEQEENNTKNVGGGAFTGEITDPKCLFGVMKPAYGKPHLSCSVRCIAGGIPPVLKSVAADGQTSYFLIAGESEKSLKEEILPNVGAQVQICGGVKKLGSWYILERDSTKSVVVLENAKQAELPVCH